MRRLSLKSTDFGVDPTFGVDPLTLGLTPFGVDPSTYSTTFGVDPKKDRLFAKRSKWWPDQESNQGHKDFQSSALPTELSGQKLKFLLHFKYANMSIYFFNFLHSSIILFTFWLVPN